MHCPYIAKFKSGVVVSLLAASIYAYTVCSVYMLCYYSLCHLACALHGVQSQYIVLAGFPCHTVYVLFPVNKPSVDTNLLFKMVHSAEFCDQDHSCTCNLWCMIMDSSELDVSKPLSRIQMFLQFQPYPQAPPSFPCFTREKGEPVSEITTGHTARSAI